MLVKESLDNVFQAPSWEKFKNLIDNDIKNFYDKYNGYERYNAYNYNLGNIKISKEIVDYIISKFNLKFPLELLNFGYATNQEKIVRHVIKNSKLPLFIPKQKWKQYHDTNEEGPFKIIKVVRNKPYIDMVKEPMKTILLNIKNNKNIVTKYFKAYFRLK